MDLFDFLTPNMLTTKGSILKNKAAKKGSMRKMDIFRPRIFPFNVPKIHFSNFQVDLLDLYLDCEMISWLKR